MVRACVAVAHTCSIMSSCYYILVQKYAYGQDLTKVLLGGGACVAVAHTCSIMSSCYYILVQKYAYGRGD